MKLRGICFVFFLKETDQDVEVVMPDQSVRITHNVAIRQVCGHCKFVCGYTEH